MTVNESRTHINVRCDFTNSWHSSAKYAKLSFLWSVFVCVWVTNEFIWMRHELIWMRHELLSCDPYVCVYESQTNSYECVTNSFKLDANEFTWMHHVLIYAWWGFEDGLRSICKCATNSFIWMRHELVHEFKMKLSDWEVIRIAFYWRCCIQHQTNRETLHPTSNKSRNSETLISRYVAARMQNENVV